MGLHDCQLDCTFVVNFSSHLLIQKMYTFPPHLPPSAPHSLRTSLPPHLPFSAPPSLRTSLPPFRAYQKRMEQFRAIRIIQRNVQSYLKLRNWQWWRLFTKVKPLLQVTNAEEQKREMEEEIKRLNDRFEKFKFEFQDLTKKRDQVCHTTLGICHTFSDEM